MAIEKRTVAGQEVGFNTETNSYCNLPKGWEAEKSPFSYRAEPDEEKKVGRPRKEREENGA